ncbi:MAG: hypothetical protein IPN14_10080 [Bacteroidetes bacterium]|jgi:hypothetical protein|nr:hypothetical protein [Bacteroidota bacterium]
MKKTRLRPCYQGPEWLNGTSSINLLKNRIGKQINGVQTFKTGVISTKRTTRYNGVSLKLQVDSNNVYLRVGKSLSDPYWKIENIVNMLSIKNPSRIIFKSDVQEWINEGKLVVSFNVLKKDHGTKWIFTEGETLFKLPKVTPVGRKYIPKIDIEIEDDFFKDL